MATTSYYKKKEPMREPRKYAPRPHAMPWVTKEMLTGARAPIAKVKSA